MSKPNRERTEKSEYEDKREAGAKGGRTSITSRAQGHSPVVGIRALSTHQCSAHQREPKAIAAPRAAGHLLFDVFECSFFEEN